MAQRDTRAFNYTYPEFAQWDTLSGEEKPHSIRCRVNRLYGMTAPVFKAAPFVFSDRPLAMPTACESASVPIP